MATGTYANARVQDDLQRARWSSIANVVAGLWLIIAPFAFSFGGSVSALWNHVIVGAVVAIVALIRSADPDARQGLSWVNVVAGLWLIVSPFVLGYSAVNAAQNNAIIMGIIITALGAFSGYETNQAHKEMGEA